jgi:general secretion pathway protein D
MNLLPFKVAAGTLNTVTTAFVLSSTLLLAGCFPQLIRDDASTKIKDGNYEAAMAGLREGVQKYPESIVLRAGLVSAKEEIASKIVTESTQQKNQGKFDEAEKLLQRGLALDLKREQFLSLQSDLAIEKRLQKRVTDAQNFLDTGKKIEALKLVDAGLHEAPRHITLVAMKRRIENEFRIEAEESGAAKGGSNRSAIADDKLISLDFRNAPITTVLEAVTRSSGINFILDRDVKQDNRVTINLRSAKVSEALDLVMGANQLARRVIDAQTLLIYPNTSEKQREHQEQVIKVFYLANADVKTTAALLKSMLRIKEAFVDERVNMIVLRESPDIIALAERLVNLHDVAEAEIMLEVEILEIKNSKLTELGINYPTTVTINAAEKTGLLGLTGKYLRDWRNGLIDVGVGGLLVNLKREVGDFNTLANPRIRAKSKEKAKILIGDKVPVVTTTTNSTGSVSANISYLDVGIKLDVESAVSPDDEVLIKLGLEVSTLAKEVRTSSGGIAYQIGTRNANTVLRLRDGETQLLGGLISNEDRSSSSRVPGLGDLPVLGRLFSSQKDDLQRTELILAITPRILRNSPRPDVAQTELWVGTEQATRLRLSPERLEMNKAIKAANANVNVSGTNAIVTASVPIGMTSAVGMPVNGQMNPQNSDQLRPIPFPANVPQPEMKQELKSVLKSKPDEASVVSSSLKGPGEVKVGEVFTVTLHVSSNALLVGLPLEFGYPSDKVEILDISESAYFRQDGGATNFTKVVNTVTGRIGIGILGINNTGVSGEGELIKLQMKSKVAGSVDIFLTSLNPLGVAGKVTVSDLAKIKIEVK